MQIRMTGLGTSVVSALAAAVVAAGGLAGGLANGSSDGSTDGSRAAAARTALVIDAALARDGRDLVDPRLRTLDAELRLPRTAAEARTDLRYFAAQGYRLTVAGPDSRAAAKATGVRVAAFRR
jgi:hypothetical protein